MNNDFESDSFFVSNEIVKKLSSDYLDKNSSSNLCLEINKKEYTIESIRKSSKYFCIELLVDKINITDIILENFDIIKIKSLSNTIKEISTNEYILKYKIIKSEDDYKVTLKFKS